MKYYSISGTDNNSEFYYLNKEVLKYCSKCGSIINRNEAIDASISTFKIKKKNYNLSSCYDGPLIASEKFVNIYVKHKLNGLKFVRLPKSEGFYLVQYLFELPYDYLYNPDIYLNKQCDQCNQWKEVSVVRPIKIMDQCEKVMRESTFYRTDLECGEKIMRSPLLLAAEPIPQIFKEEEVKDVYFEAAGRDFIIGNLKSNIFR